MRKILPIMFVIIGLSACGTSEGVQEIPRCESNVGGASGCEVTIKYMDKDIHCLSWGGSHGETGLTCDFVRYWKENKVK